MKITFIKQAANGDYLVYSLSGDSQLTVVGDIARHHRGFYIFNDHLYGQWWNDTKLRGLMEEIRKYYQE